MGGKRKEKGKEENGKGREGERRGEKREAEGKGLAGSMSNCFLRALRKT